MGLSLGRLYIPSLHAPLLHIYQGLYIQNYKEFAELQTPSGALVILHRSNSYLGLYWLEICTALMKVLWLKPCDFLFRKLYLHESKFAERPPYLAYHLFLDFWHFGTSSCREFGDLFQIIYSR